MASQDRNPNTDIDFLSQLQKTPYHYGYFAALRHIENLHKNKPRIGYAKKPSDDAVRFGQMPTMQFAPSTLSSFTCHNDRPAQLKVFFFGVFGPNGPLPLHLTEYVRNRIRNAKDDTFAEFADLFHHRLLSLFYRAWADKEPTIQLDRPDTDRFSFYTGALLGIAGNSLQNRDAIPDHVKLHFAAHLGCHTKHASGLTSILADYFQVSVKVQELIGEWLNMPTDSYCYLDEDTSTGQLGISATIGTKSWQCQHKFRIIMGPLTLAQYESFLPTGNKLESLESIVNNYVGFEFSWDVNLILEKSEVPTAKLGQYGQLGWTSWLQSDERKQNVNDLYLTVGEME